MNTLILSFAIFAIAMFVMAVGVILGNREIKGSCGGLNSIEGLEGACDICEIKEQCKRRRHANRQSLSHTSQQSSEPHHDSQANENATKTPASNA